MFPIIQSTRNWPARPMCVQGQLRMVASCIDDIHAAQSEKRRAGQQMPVIREKLGKS